jgi:hypothetical protein
VQVEPGENQQQHGNAHAADIRFDADQAAQQVAQKQAQQMAGCQQGSSVDDHGVSLLCIVILFSPVTAVMPMHRDCYCLPSVLCPLLLQ